MNALGLGLVNSRWDLVTRTNFNVNWCSPQWTQLVNFSILETETSNPNTLRCFISNNFVHYGMKYALLPSSQNVYVKKSYPKIIIILIFKDNINYNCPFLPLIRAIIVLLLHCFQ